MTEGELETLVEGFAYAIELSGNPFIRWMEELGRWVLRNNEIPRPSDIMNIIDPPPAKLSPTLYIQIKKNLIAGNVFVTDEEKRFCREFEKQELAKAGGTEEYKGARREIDQYRETLQIESCA